MSKRKDLRNGRESGTWKPHRWSPVRAAAFTSHVLTVILMEFEREMPRHEATQAFGKFLYDRQQAANEYEIKRRGIRTIGA